MISPACEEGKPSSVHVTLRPVGSGGRPARRGRRIWAKSIVAAISRTTAAVMAMIGVNIAVGILIKLDLHLPVTNRANIGFWYL